MPYLLKFKIHSCLQEGVHITMMRIRNDTSIHRMIAGLCKNEADDKTRKAYPNELKFDNYTGKYDKLLSNYGYERNGKVYNVRNSNEKVVAFFCHFGITSVLVSYLWGVSPFVPLQFFAMAPTSLTELVTEEREKGIAVFRTLRIGDITHLTMGKESPSFSARFCEQFENDYERH